MQPWPAQQQRPRGPRLRGRRTRAGSNVDRAPGLQLRSQGQASPIITAPSRERDLPSRAEACRDHPRAPGAGLGMETGGSAPPGRFVDRRGGRSRRRARDTVAASAAGAYRAPTQRSRRGRSTASRAPTANAPPSSPARSSGDLGAARFEFSDFAFVPPARKPRMAETSIGHRLTKFNVNDAPANARGTVHPINLARRANQRVRERPFAATTGEGQRHHFRARSRRRLFR